MSSTSPSRCGLPGCAAAVAVPRPGAAPRRYCSAEHRRRHRGQTRPEPARPELPLDVEQAPPVPPERPPARPRRGRLVVLGVAGVLAGAAGWIGAAGAPVPPPWQRPDVPVVEPGAGWLTRARATLASLDGQLDMVERAERAWAASGAPGRITAHGLPPPVRALLERKSLLEQQRAALWSQVSTWEALDRAGAALAVTDEQLAAVDAAIAATASDPGLDADETTVLNALRDQRALLAQVRDAHVAELHGLEAAVAAARGTPLPDASDRTSPIAMSVLALAADP